MTITTFVNSLKNNVADLKRSKSVKIFLIFFALATLLIVSDIVYVLNNDSSRIPGYYTAYHLNRTQVLAQESNIQQALNHLDKAVGSKLKEVDKKYPNLTLETSMIIPALPDNPDLIKAYLGFLREIDYDYLKESYVSKWAKIYYVLGLTAHKHNELDLVVPLWQVAANLAPEWSYFHVELANFYLTQGEMDKAHSQIEHCMQFHFPQAHCRQFMEENVQTNLPEAVGSWEKQIKDI